MHRLVIVGGGIAGLSLATKLGRHYRRSKSVEITLVDPSFAHVWKPMLHTFASGTANSYQQRIPFLSHGARFGFGFMPGALTAVDRCAKRIRVGAIVAPDGAEVLGPREILYDDLLLAAGSQVNDFGTAGVAEHCLSIDNLPQAERFNDRLYASLLRTAAAGEGLAIAIVGGGATGVELAAEISRLLDLVKSYGGPDLRPRLHLTLIESGPRILAAFPEVISAAATAQLRRLGIDVRLDTRVVSVDAGGFVLADATRIDAGLRVWAAGVKAVDGIEVLRDFEQTRGGQLIIRPTLQTTTDDHVFALGDCASLPVPGGRPLPPTAQVARQKAAHLARAYPAWLKGGSLPAFAFRDFGGLVSLGAYSSYGTLGQYGLLRGSMIRGQVARVGHAMLYRLHQAELHGVMPASALWLSDAIASSVRPRIRAS